MNYSKLFLLCLLLFYKLSANSQNNEIIIKVYPSIGDTLDETENTKYKIFNDYDDKQFKYVVYKFEKNNYTAYLTLKNGNTIAIPYSAEKILKDAEKIVAFSNSPINDEIYDENKKKWHINPSIIAGAWIPTGELSILGVHPNLGFQGEAAYSKLSMGIEFSCKFIDSNKPYNAKRVHTNNKIEKTNSFFGGYFGFIGGYDLINTNWHRIRLIGGAALDGFDALDQKGNLKSESISAFNLNIGIGYCYKYNKTKYLGIQVKYNYVDYTISNIVEMTGQPITVNLEFGILNLKKPKHKKRR